jgi:hypothetical protein
MEVDVGDSGCVEGEEGEHEQEVEEDEDEEIDNAESGDDDDDDEEEEEEDTVLLKADVERRCLSHFTAYVCSRDTCLLREMIY